MSLYGHWGVNADLVLDMGLESPRFLVLGDFNTHAEAVEDKLAQDILATMTTLGTSQVIPGPVHQGAYSRPHVQLWPG